MAPQSQPFSPEDIRDAIVAYFNGELEIHLSFTKFNVPSRKLRCSTDELSKVNELRKLANQEVLLNIVRKDESIDGLQNIVITTIMIE